MPVGPTSMSHGEESRLLAVVTMGGTTYLAAGAPPVPLNAPLSTDAALWTSTATVEGGEGAAPAAQI
jgi:hypothetical protein